MEQYDDQAVAQAFEGIKGADDFLERTTAPARTAIEAAIDAQRSTPVYSAAIEQPSPDAWNGQPNSAL